MRLTGEKSALADETLLQYDLSAMDAPASPHSTSSTSLVTPEQVREMLQNVLDPELGYNIVDLGLVYDVTVDGHGNVIVLMTLTSPGCPLGDVIEKEVHDKTRLLPGIGTVTVTITFNPPWSPGKASDDLKREFTLMGIPIGE